MIVLSALLVLTALAWGYVIWLAAHMAASPAMAGMPAMNMQGMGMITSAFAPWTTVHFLFM